MNIPTSLLVQELIEGMSGTDEELGRTLLDIAIRDKAESLGVEPELIAEAIIQHIPQAETDDAKLTTVEKALHKAAAGQFEIAGKLIRSHLENGAIEIKKNEIAAHYVPIGIRRSKQAKEFGSSGAFENRAKGVENRDAVLQAAKKFAAQYQATQQPSVRNIAPKIGKDTDLSERTVRKHLTKKLWDKIWESRRK